MKVCIFGASGGLGFAFLKHYLSENETTDCVAIVRNKTKLLEKLNIHQISHDNVDIFECDATKENDIETLSNRLSENTTKFSLLINCIGALHNNEFKPEKSLKNISVNHLNWSYEQNLIPCALITTHFSSLMDNAAPSFIVNITAKVGSISDNRLGGWYAYRIAKASMHMFIKTASIELKRKNKQLAIVAIHPGTTDTDLSKPFQTHVPPEKLFSPEKSVSLMINNHISQLSPEKTGTFLNWDGSELPW